MFVRSGGRALVGKWTPDGMAFINSLTVDASGQLWVAEADMQPKRFSCWDTHTGALVKEYMGPTTTLLVEWLGGRVHIVVPRRATVRPGDRVCPRIDPAHAVLFDPASAPKTESTKEGR